MKNPLSSLIDRLIEYVRRRRLDALYRRTSENRMWKAECPDFLDRDGVRPPETQREVGSDAVDGALKVVPAHGSACFLHDGVRTVFLGTRE